MTKSKRQPKNFFRYFVDEFILFRRDLRYELQDAPSIVARKLGNLRYEPQSYWIGKRRIVPKVWEISGGWAFELSSEQPSRTGYMCSAKAEGKLFKDAEIDILEGHTVMNAWVFWLSFAPITALTIAVFYMLTRVQSDFLLMPCVIMCLFLLLIPALWLRMFNDRNHLLKLIQSAVESAEHEAQAAKINP